MEAHPHRPSHLPSRLSLLLLAALRGIRYTRGYFIGSGTFVIGGGAEAKDGADVCDAIATSKEMNDDDQKN